MSATELVEKTPPVWRRRWIGVLILLALTGSAYFGVSHCGFTTFDDPDYVTQNPYVKQGLTPASIHWAFTEFHSSNWHPLTWFSHMLDVQFFGQQAAAHHWHNVLLHSLNAVLLFLLFTRLTGFAGRAFVVAALFALHPLHVESVAWVAERKDVLSTFFGLLALTAYSRYATESKVPGLKSKVWYAAALMGFAFGLMSKPMLVTWPCVMLLMDLWPLRRIEFSTLNPQRSILKRLVWEKLPFFALSIVSSAITMHAQGTGRSVISLDWLPFEVRIGNSLAAVFDYLARTFVPLKLAVFYPFPVEVPWGKALLTIVILGVLFAIAIRCRKTEPALFVGLAWFCGTLVPVIGLVQVGMQASADRYVYIPHIGLFVALVWGVCRFAASVPRFRLLAGGATGLALLMCWLLTIQQVKVWRNDFTLFEHAKNVTERNYIALTIYGKQLADQGKNEAALSCYEEALRIQPRYAVGHYVSAEAYRNLGRTNDALANYNQALQLDPFHVESLNSRGALFSSLKQYDEAERDFSKAIELMPMFVLPQFNLGVVLQHQGKLAAAGERFKKYLKLEPKSAKAWTLLGDVEFRQGKLESAIAAYRKSLSFEPDRSEAQFGLACAFVASRRFSEAEQLLVSVVIRETAMPGAFFQLGIAQTALGKALPAVASFQQAVKLSPTSALYRYHLAGALSQATRKEEAVAAYEGTLELDPDFFEAMNNLSWILATDPDASFRQPERAVELGIRACELTKQNEPLLVGTLAAAYASAGRFDDAVTTAQRAIELARAAGQTNLATRNAELLELYRARKPYHEPITSQ